LEGREAHPCTRIGETVISLKVLEEIGVFKDITQHSLFVGQSCLGEFMKQ